MDRLYTIDLPMMSGMIVGLVSTGLKHSPPFGQGLIDFPHDIEQVMDKLSTGSADGSDLSVRFRLPAKTQTKVNL